MRMRNTLVLLLATLLVFPFSVKASADKAPLGTGISASRCLVSALLTPAGKGVMPALALDIENLPASVWSPYPVDKTTSGGNLKHPAGNSFLYCQCAWLVYTNSATPIYLVNCLLLI